ncbi:MAG TPA: ATP-binding protein [Anaeromyxobacteraceae bacterium]|nr:ATP-binding protein [Anaeromyxobacteraceae bacterium]
MAATEIRHRARLAKEYGPVPAIQANDSRLGQVVLNLLINAAHAVREGAAERNEIRVVTRTDAGGNAVIEVHDTGIGIPPENLERIFEPFFTTKAVGVGTGLGLSICRRLVEAMTGEINVESEVGRGSVFRVILPPRHGAGPVPAAERAPERPAPGGRVLVLDDEPGVAHAIRRLLAREHRVEVETSSRAALRRLEAGERFDLVVCDLMMPEMDGMEFHARLATASPEMAARVLFLTGGAFTPATAAFLQRVRNPSMQKPFETDELRRTVRELVRAAAG